MDAQKLEHFKRKLLAERERHLAHINDNQQDARQMAEADDGVKDAADMSLLDVNQEIEYRLSERESQLVAEIEEALRRIAEGTYGICERCGKPIDERRLEALPTARYDAACQAVMEAGQETPSL
ncbi:MAG: RNA polymerase-binding protein DksA [Pyrinomonas sp.]|uniref:TraR/DksA family transcriptional regulator n=1 Tax=Pyrinomonas sp. TaxID=2080306 RepID=UPI00332EA8B0